MGRESESVGEPARKDLVANHEHQLQGLGLRELHAQAPNTRGRDVALARVTSSPTVPTPAPPHDGHAIALRTAPSKMYDQGDDRDDQENVNQAPRDAESDPTKNPCDNNDDK